MAADQAIDVPLVINLGDMRMAALAGRMVRMRTAVFASTLGTLVAFAVCYGCEVETPSGQGSLTLDSGAFDGLSSRSDAPTGQSPDDAHSPDRAGDNDTGAGGGDGGGADADASRRPDASTLQCSAGTGDCDLDPENGCETTLDNDDHHCGACGRDCAAAGTTCQNGKCLPITLHSNYTAIGTDNGNARSFAFGNGAIYHVQYNGYSVSKLPIDGSSPSTFWTTTGKAAGTEGIVFTGTDVLWSERGSPSVMLKKVYGAASGDLPQIAFTPEFEAGFVRLSNGKLFWASGNYQSGNTAGYIYSRDLGAGSGVAGTKLVSVDQGTHGAMLALEPTTDAIYWVTSGPANDPNPYDLRRVPLAGGTPTAVPGGAIAAYFFAERTHLQGVGNTIYFNRNIDVSALNGIYRYTPGDVAPTQVVMAEDVTSFLITGSDIYYVSNAAGGVWRAPITGGAGTQINEGNAGGGAATIVGVDATYVYVVNPSCCYATVYKVVR